MSQTAGGAIEAGETPLDGAVKEAGEECELSEDIVRRYAKYVYCRLPFTLSHYHRFGLINIGVRAS